VTTIAFDGRHLAADSLVTSDIKYQKPFRKVRKFRNGIIAAGAGSLSQLVLFFEWCNLGMPDDEIPVHDLDAIIIIEGIPYQFNGALVPLDIDPPFSLGSGAHIALGAMAAGASARKAVSIAARYDPGTGGSVNWVRL